MNLLITGASGYLGSHVLKRALATQPAWNLGAAFFSHPINSPRIVTHPLDLCDERALSQIVNEIKPDAIIHTAAVMGRDGLEPKNARGEAWALNVQGTTHLAHAAARSHARLIHVSTDVLFDGENAPYDEDAPLNPLHRYGASKAQAERALVQAIVNCVIVRTSLIYGFAPLDPRTSAMCEGKMNRLFVDEFRSPLWVNDLADALLELSAHNFCGVLNVAGGQRLNRYEFGVKLRRALTGDASSLVPALRAESNLVRARDCTLDISRARRILKTKLRGVDETLTSLNKEAFE